MDVRLAFQTRLKISPQLLLINRLLATPVAEMESLLNRELDENPALELADPPLRSAGLGHAPTAGQDFEAILERLPAREPALDRLWRQLSLLTGPDRELAGRLLHRLDDRGYLAPSAEEAAAELGVSVADLECARRLLHQLEPAGIGARDLRECLLIQCDQLEGDEGERRLLRRMLAECWDDCVNHRWRAVARRLSVPPQAVAASWSYLRRRCYPHPLTLIADDSPQEGPLAGPDLIIRREPGDQPAYRLEIPGAERFELRLSDAFDRAARPPGGPAWARELTPEQQAWADAWLERARLFIAAFNRRWATLERIGRALIRRQEAFLEAGPRFLKPLTQADLAAELGLHESTISRAVSGKVVQLPDGRLRPLAELFDPSLAAKESIRQLLAQGQAPLADHEIAAHLRSEGLPLARRTVAKYRRQMHLDSSHHSRPLFR